MTISLNTIDDHTRISKKNSQPINDRLLFNKVNEKSLITWKQIKQKKNIKK